MDKVSIARNKLQDTIDKGRIQAAEAIRLAQQNQPKDFIVPTRSMTFLTPEDQREVRLTVNHNDAEMDMGLHKHALNQISDYVKIPRKYVETLTSSGGWGRSLLALNLNTMYRYKDTTRRLVRTVHGEVRGFLSDKYRRIDTALCLEAFVGAIQKHGAVPIRANSLDTKMYIHTALPNVIEPFPGEPMIMGVSMKNSEYGDGAFEIALYIMRLLCLNGMTGTDGIRRVHLGSRISDNMVMSNKTYELDSQTIASATTDVVDNILSSEFIRNKMEILRKANNEKVNIREAVDALRKSGKINSAEAEGIVDVYNHGGVEELPPGNTAWRFSNALSFFAKEAEPNRRLELESLAGKVAGIN